MTEERKQSPHYIPELDPEKRPYYARRWLVAFWASIAGTIIGLAGTVWAVPSGNEVLGIAFLIMFLLSFAVLCVIAYGAFAS